MQGVYLLLKKSFLIKFNDSLNKVSDEYKFYMIQGFCKNIKVSDVYLIKDILAEVYSKEAL